MKWLCAGVVILAVGVSIGAVTGDAGPSYDFKSPTARSAAEVYSGTVARATREFKDKSDSARKTFIGQLTTAQQAATKAGNLDEAVKIRDVITKLNAETQEAATSHGSGPAAERQRLTASLVNSVWQTGDTKIRFNDDGTGIYVGSDKPPWEWVAMDGRSIYIRYSNGWTNRLEFDEAGKVFAFQEFGSPKKMDAQGGKRIASP
jgi:hypothetical protein